MAYNQSQNSNQIGIVENQKFKSNQINSEEQILKFTVRQDFLNVLGIAADFQAGLELQKKNNNLGQYETMLHNKLILQVNLSNSIHCDQYNQYLKSPHLAEILKKEKLKAKEFLQSIKQKEKFDKKIEEQLQFYETNCLVDRPFMQQQELKNIQHEVKFNQETVQNIINSINQTDQKYRDLQDGNTQAEELSVTQIDEHIQSRKKQASDKLSKQLNKQKGFQDCCQLF
ncbi:unnamed protein product [Paramecium sonneborni]|uniref:Uncharacterized protein n=1 Tax=Paramecium sonneborni TaxID=65129 RepID=A0A8S1LE66_9CILI|nr:unnamed protein product [Paramecium sonneborni]